MYGTTDLHEKDVGNVEFPHVVFIAELHALPEDLLHLSVVFSIPVDPRLGHQDRHIAAQAHRDSQRERVGDTLIDTYTH